MDSEADWFFDTHGVLPGSFFMHIVLCFLSPRTYYGIRKTYIWDIYMEIQRNTRRIGGRKSKDGIIEDL